MFVHLNNHSDYSLKQSISTVHAIIDRVKELKQDTIAITDYGNLFYAAEFASLCQKNNIKPIFGCELFLVEDRLARMRMDFHCLTLLCLNAQGFENLKKISSAGYIEGFYYYPRIDMTVIKEYHEGLICIIPQNKSKTSDFLELGKTNQAQEEVLILQQIFGDRLYLEIQNHGISQEFQLNEQIKTLAQNTRVELVAGNDCHYPYQKDAKLHDVFINTESRKMSSLKRIYENDQYYIKSQEEMETILKDFPDALKNTEIIANRCIFEFKFIGPQLPSFPLPEPFKNEDEYLRHLTMEGLRTRYPTLTQTIIDRANFEIETITSMKYSGYFLIVWDIIAFAKTADIPVGLGRGSAAGSIVAYALSITNIDPLKYGLLFERFLNPDRVSMPDIDTDFCVDRRQEIIEYIKQRYGEDHVGQIITFSQLKPRGTLRDVARSISIPLEKADEIAKLIPFESNSLKEAEDIEPKLKAMHEGEYKELLDNTEKLIGLHRHASLHAAGIVIGAEKLTTYVPLYRDPKSKAVSTQYSMKYLEDCGLVKMDILGLRTLTIIHNAEKLIRKIVPDFSIEKIPERDPATFKMLSEGDSMSVFQFESSGMQRMLSKVRPSKVEDLIALNALYRPGPMEHIDTYALVKNGKQQAKYLHDSLRPILEETQGIIIYQEQVMEIARKIAGFTLARADLMRRAMGKKDAEEMKRQLPLFIEGAKEKGFDEKTAKAIYSQLAPFAEYGFNKSHSAAYAILAYQTAYLKRHFPIQFIIECINAVCNKQNELTKQLKVCRSLGIEILPPDINLSDYDFSMENGKVRYGLNAIKTISDDTKIHVVEERKKNGPYTSILNCTERLHTPNAMIKFLKAAIPSGLFDQFDDNRVGLFLNIDYLCNESQYRLNAKKENRMTLFPEELINENLEGVKETQITQMEGLEEELILQEREFLGIYLTRYPLDPYKELWLKATTIDLSKQSFTHLQKVDTHTKRKPLILIVGYIDTVKQNINKERERKTQFGTIEDYNGEISFVMSQNVNQSQDIKERTVYGIVGYIQFFEEDNDTIFRIKEIMTPQALIQRKKEIAPQEKSLEERISPPSHMHITIKTNTPLNELEHLKSLLISHFGDTRLILHTKSTEQHARNKSVYLPQGFTVDAENATLRSKLAETPFVENVWCN